MGHLLLMEVLPQLRRKLMTIGPEQAVVASGLGGPDRFLLMGCSGCPDR